MELADILVTGSVIACAKAASKRQVLQQLADKASAELNIDCHDIFETLVAREKLGSTGLGNGIAIPHGKIDGIDGVTAVFARLEQPVDFEAVDDEPVDLVMMLLAPTGSGADHLKALARVARLLRTESITAKLRSTRDVEKIYECLTSPIEEVDAA